MERALKAMPLMVAMALAAGCGSSTSPSAPSPSVEAAAVAPKADIHVTLGSDAVTGPSIEPGYKQFVRFTTTLSEAAGLGAHLNYVRGDFYLNNELVDRYEFTGAQLLEETGSNRLEARSSRRFLVLLRWNAQCDLIRTTFQFTDDRGNEHHLVGNISASSTAVAASPDDGDTPRL